MLESREHSLFSFTAFPATKCLGVPMIAAGMADDASVVGEPGSRKHLVDSMVAYMKNELKISAEGMFETDIYEVLEKATLYCSVLDC